MLQISPEMYEPESPFIGYIRLNDELVRDLMEAAGKIFSEKELKNLHQFILRNNNFDDVITLRVKRGFKINKTEKRKGKIVKFPSKAELIDIKKFA